MCEELIPCTKHRCGYVVDQNGTLREYENCGNCGTVKHTSYLGQTTKKDRAAIRLLHGVGIE